MRRRDMPILLLSAAATQAPGTSAAEAQDGRLPFHQRTIAETVAGVIPTDLGYNEGDFRRYGASTASEDNSAAINAALLVAAHAGNAVFIPPGTWKIGKPLRCGLSCSMFGTGQHSVISPQSCDGLIFEAQTAYSGSRFFRDFHILGTDTRGHTAILINLSAESRERITAVQFSNLTIQNFALAVFTRGLWNSSFRDCFLYNNFCGYHFHGQNVLNSIVGGFIQKASTTGTGTSYGILVDSVDGESCQSLHMNAMGVYAYDVNICLSLALYTSIENCDISVATSIGVQLITVFGGTTIRDCWIQTNSASATTGIQIADRQVPACDKILIEGCALVCNLPHPRSIGIYVGGNQLAVTTNDNTIGTATNAFATGISNVGAHNHVAKFNTIYATSNAVLVTSSASDVEVGPNSVQKGTPIAFTARTAPNFSYYGNGTFILELRGLSGVVRGPMHWTANGRTIHLSLSDKALVGKSNSTSLIATGLPTHLAPTARRCMMTSVIDNDIKSLAEVAVDPEGSIVFAKDANGAAFTASGTKGLPAATGISYHL
jgi:hypothetical protein